MSYISAQLRRQVEERAGFRCEYCLIPASHDFLSHEIDHIIAEKHGGQTIEANLCESCFECNRYKGSDIASVDWETENIVEPLSPVGRVTVFLLKLNHEDRLEERQLLIEAGSYPG
jgi:5-methylcytosine-specific restriction endonuclease McrA